MHIKTLFFGAVKDITNSNSIELVIEENTSVEQFVTLLQGKFKTFPAIDDFTVAVNENYVEKDFILKANDVVAIIPPVSGG